MIAKSDGPVTTFVYDGTKADMFFTSDVHFDSIYCARKQFFSDMDQAVERDAKIFIFGDFFDAMNGRFDPRRDMGKVRPEYRRSDYYDYLIMDSAEKLKKYAPHIAMITPGNHETSVLKNANTYLTDRLVSALNQAGGTIVHGGYGGWVRVMLKPKDHFSATILIKYFHGSGGEAPVTRGVIQTNRQAVYLPDADVVVNGHSHNAYWVPITRERVSGKGKQYFDTQHHVRMPGYNQAYGDGSQGWEIERGGVPKPIGGSFVNFECHSGLGLEIRKQITVTSHIHNPQPVTPIFDIYNGIIFPQE